MIAERTVRYEAVARRPRAIDHFTEFIGGVSVAAVMVGTGPKSMVDALGYERLGQIENPVAPPTDAELLSSPELASSDLSLSIGYSAARSASELRAVFNASNQPSYYGAHPQGQVR